MLNKKEKKKLSDAVSAAQAACILEASIEKPGNVTPTHGFDDTIYDDFIIGSLAVRSSIEEAAIRGFEAGKKERSLSDIGVGGLIYKGVCEIKKARKGGNTHLGILLLLIPLSSAAGYCIAKKKSFNELRKATREIVSHSTTKDAECFYSAIKASGAGGLGRLIEEEKSFPELLRASAEKDRLSEELAGDAPILFDVGLSALEDYYAESDRLGDALLKTYLLILSKYPDTLIAKKTSRLEAEKVSSDAGKVLSGKMTLDDFDWKLRRRGNLLNPGTTADLVCGVLFLWLLKKKVLA